MQLVFHKSDHHLQSLITDSNDCPATSLMVFGQPLLLRNIQIAKEIFDIDTVILPEECSNAIKLIEDRFPSIRVEQFSDDEYNINNDRIPPLSPHLLNSKNREFYKGAKFKVPLNTFIHPPTKVQGTGEEPCLRIDSVVYPWDFLRVIQKVLYDNIRDTIISPNASIAKSSIIEGPCIIEDDVTIDDFCKIKGPYLHW